MLTLSKSDAKRFFDGLYKGRPAATSVERDTFYEIATRLVARSSNQSTVGATALQALLLNYVAQQKDKRTDIDFVSLAHISRPGVAALIQAYPDITLDKLVDTARAAGYDVEVIGTTPK